MTARPDIRPFAEADRAALIDLWHQSGLTRPWNDPGLDIDRNQQAGLALLVAVASTEIVGSVMVGYDGHRGWVNYLAVDNEQRGSGLGRRLMEAAEAALDAVDCPKLNLQIREDNRGAVEFYQRLGYTVEAAVSMGKRLRDDEPETSDQLP